MYDALDRPFMFGCRTNGALRWDGIRRMHGLGGQEYEPAEEALLERALGNEGRLLLWQEEGESLPVSPSFAPIRIGNTNPDLASDYCGIVESSLGATYLFSRHFTAGGDLLFVTGGASRSEGVLRRIAGIWKREVIPIRGGSAVLGAAVSGAYSLLALGDNPPGIPEFTASFISRGRSVHPSKEDLNAYHGENGFIARLSRGYEAATGNR
jgi:xylulokinase